MGKADFLARQQQAAAGDDETDDIGLTTPALAANDGGENDGAFDAPDAVAEELARLRTVTNAEPSPEPEPEPEDDPYDVLQRQFDELQAERDGIAAQRANEQRRIQELETQQAAAQASEIENHRAIVEHAIAATNTEIEEAKRAYRQARELGDIEAELAATEALADAKDKSRQLYAGHAEIVRRMESAGKPQPQPAAQAGDPVEAYIDANFQNQRDRTWLRQHKTDIFGDEAKQKLALAGHDIATLQHKIAPGTDAYYQFMDEHMGYTATEAGGARQAARTATAKPAAPARQKPAPSAPPSRSALAAPAAAERASPEIAALAESLGMTASKYMANLKAIKANGGYIPGTSNRRQK